MVTHTDGHNQSGNIHTHIVINSVRKYSADREPYMTQPHDHEAGYKHRSTDKFFGTFQKRSYGYVSSGRPASDRSAVTGREKDHTERIYGSAVRTGKTGKDK